MAYGYTDFDFEDFSRDDLIAVAKALAEALQRMVDDWGDVQLEDVQQARKALALARRNKVVKR